MANIILDKEMFFRRIKRLYADWKVRQISSKKKNQNQRLDAHGRSVGLHTQHTLKKSQSARI